MLTLPIIFISSALHSFSAVWLERFRLTKDFSHYFLFLSFPPAPSHGASPTICLPYVENFTEPLLWKVCVCTCACVWVSERKREWEGEGEGSPAYVCAWQRFPCQYQSQWSLISSRPECRSSLIPTAASEVHVSTSLVVTLLGIESPCRRKIKAGVHSFRHWLSAKAGRKGQFSTIRHHVTEGPKQSREESREKNGICSFGMWPHSLIRGRFCFPGNYNQ